MGSGNPLLKRLVRGRTEARPVAPPSAARAWGAEPSPAVRSTDRALLLVLLTLVAGALAWWSLTSAPDDAWQVRNDKLVGFAAFAIVVAIMLIASFKPLANAAAACLFALAQGVLFGWVASAFAVVSPGLFANALLGTVLVALSALAFRRTSLARRGAALSIAVAAVTGLAALGLVNAVVDLDGSTAPVSWFPVLVTVVMGVVTAFSFHIDLGLVDDFAGSDEAGGQVWAAALGLTAGLTGVYVWRFFNSRDRDGRSSSSAAWGSDSGSNADAGSDSGGSSSD